MRETERGREKRVRHRFKMASRLYMYSLEPLHFYLLP